MGGEFFLPISNEICVLMTAQIFIICQLSYDKIKTEVKKNRRGVQIKKRLSTMNEETQQMCRSSPLIIYILYPRKVKAKE